MTWVSRRLIHQTHSDRGHHYEQREVKEWRVPLRVENRGSTTVSFVLSFAPPPPRVDLATLTQSAIDRGRIVIEAPDVEEVVGPAPSPVSQHIQPLIVRRCRLREAC